MKNRGVATAIINGTIVNEGLSFKGDIIIREGLIEAIYKEGELPPLKKIGDIEIIDVEGSHIFPGVIDDQVHFREPGNAHKGTIESESAAAVLGGVTSYMDMPNNNPAATTIAALENKNSIAARHSYANYSFYLGATNENIEEIKALNKRESCGVKVFMGSSTGNMLVNNPHSLEQIFAHSPTLIATHCEEETIIRKNLKEAIERYGEKEIPFSCHPKIRDREACIKSTQKAVELALRYNSRLHILHISTKEEVQILRELSNQTKSITGEVCVHYMLLDSTMYDTLGSKMKCNPAIKERNDREAIIQAVKDGVIKVVATDHAPHTKEEKENPYLQAPSGLPLIQHSLQIMLELHKERLFTLEEIADRMSHSPANLFKIERRGFIREGYYADLAIVNLNKIDAVSTTKPAYLCGWSPFEGKIFNSSVIHTFVNGLHTVSNGELTGKRAPIKLLFNHEE